MATLFDKPVTRPADWPMPASHKALSVRQPYAFAITMGFKTVENRDWQHPFRGPVLIHAGKKEETDDVDGVLRLIQSQQPSTPLKVIEKGYLSHRQLGAIVGAATIIDCVTKHNSTWFVGPHAFVLEKVFWLFGPECRGALGFFDVPRDVLERIYLPQYGFGL